MVFVSVGAGIDIAKLGRNVTVVEDGVGRVCVFGAPSLSSDQTGCNRQTVQVQSLQLVHTVAMSKQMEAFIYVVRLLI